MIQYYERESGSQTMMTRMMEGRDCNCRLVFFGVKRSVVSVYPCVVPPAMSSSARTQDKGVKYTKGR